VHPTGRHLDALLEGAGPALEHLAGAIASGAALRGVRVEGWAGV
jgi:hypothetical protein